MKRAVAARPPVIPSDWRGSEPELAIHTRLLGAVLVLISPILWALGSVWSKRLDLADGAMGTAAQMVTGGVLLAAMAPVFGERMTEAPGLSSWLALGYLIVFGSIVAFSAYMYLLRTVRPALATSYAYVNPVVAVLLGMTLGNEIVGVRSLAALPMILLGVGLLAGERRRMPFGHLASLRSKLGAVLSAVPSPTGRSCAEQKLEPARRAGGD